jgi:hypothetical protein
MPALAITLNQLAAALLGAGAYIYHTGQRRGWNACAIVCGTRIERSSPDPYAALAAVAATLVEYEAQQVAQDAHDSPAARAAYRQAWAATEGQPVLARFAAAEAAAVATESADWPSTIRTEQDNAHTMQRLRSITGRPSAAEAAPVASSDEQPAEDDETQPCRHEGREEGRPCYDCYLQQCHKEEIRKRETQSPPPACLQIPLPNLERIASLPF